MSMLKVQNLQKSYGSMTVLADVSFSLDKGQKVALVGNNGTGKTTLLKILAGLVEADAGEVEITRGANVGYLPQDTSLTGNETIGEYLRRVTGVDQLEKDLERLSHSLEQSALALEYEEVKDKYERLDGYAFKHRMEVMLAGFGLEGVGLDRPLSQLSSGQKSKVALTGILLKGVDLLLLDEPTNNLDLPALIWLEDFLQKSDAACVMISHDRRFLDRVVRKIFEIDWQTRELNVSKGTYSDYLETVAKRRVRQYEDYRLQQDEITRLSEQARQKRQAAVQGAKWVGSDNDKFLRGFKRNQAGGSARVAKAIEKRIDQMDKVEKPFERDSLEIPLQAVTSSSNLGISLREVVVSYDTGFKLGPISLEVNYGSRVGILGLNGSGKSTLLSVITRQLTPQEGVVEIGSGLRVGNMMQEHQTLPREQTLLNFLVERGLEQQASYAILAKFGFEESQMKGRIEALSPGGRARLLLALFSAQSVNVLVLDEPTNHLDLEALEALEEVVASYQGTVILVSHDRYFLEKANLDSAYVLTAGALTRLSSIEEYVKQAEEKAKNLIKVL